ncbi:MAG: small basic family protein [Clostridia bacterium]|nr:small basic family protein [Clostridia bacterium]
MIGTLIVIVFVIIGYVLGSDIVVPYAFTEYIAVAILAFLDSLFGAAAANSQKKFSIVIFITGFFGNAIIAIFLVYLGQKLNMDIYLAAVIVFSSRLFNNFSIVRRSIIEDIENKRKEKKKTKIVK